MDTCEYGQCTNHFIPRLRSSVLRIVLQFNMDSKDNRSDGKLDLFPRVAIELTQNKVQPRVHFPVVIVTQPNQSMKSIVNDNQHQSITNNCHYSYKADIT